MDNAFSQTMLELLEPWFATLQTLRDRADAQALYHPSTAAGRIRLANLRVFFGQLMRWHPSVLLIGEAPGYRGTRWTGINFTSERIMMGPKDRFGLYGGTEAGYRRINDEGPLRNEASSTVVHRVIQELPEPPLVWPALPMHPHKPGQPLSNRTPTLAELRRDGLPQLRQLMDIYQPRHVAAVGNVGHRLLGELGIDAAKIRHPAHGGGPAFRAGLLALMDDAP